MRTLIPLLLLTLSCFSGIAQNKPSKAGTVQQLQRLLTQERPAAGQKAHHNATTLCVLKEARNTEIKDKEFTSRIESYISWAPGEVKIENDIFEHGKLKETYTYQVPLSAVISARLSNCQKNKYSIVDAYKDRPLFITVKKNTVRISHTSYDKNGSVRNTTTRMNKAEVDWDSVIPLVVDWHREAGLEEKAETCFRKLAEFNEKSVASK